jgi:hypothetical protein
MAGPYRFAHLAQRMLEQIVFDWNRMAIPIKRVNLLYLFDVEQFRPAGNRRRGR